MSEEFKFSDPGEGLQEAEVLEIHVGEGDHVNDGDTILTVETDKAATDVQAPFSGTIEKVHLKTGDVVRVDDVLLSYAPDDGNGEDNADSGEKDEKDDKDQEEEQSESDDEDESSQQSDRESSEESGEDEETGQDDQDDQKTSGEDEKQGDRQEKDAEEKKQDKQKDNPDKKTRKDRVPIPAAPSTRRLARERGVDLHDIEPSGPQGRITAEDVEAAAETGDRQSSGAGKKPGTKALPDFSQWGDTERVAIRSVRRVIAERMTQSWTRIPHVYHQDVADVTELERFRHDYEASAQVDGGKFTLTILVMKAMVFALKQYPGFNASLDEDNQEIVLKGYFHIGLAVATDRGLLVPVIRDVDKKNLIELTEAVSTIVERARRGELGREDMEGGCMTLTNPGPLGGTALTPLINLPEVAILGLGQARLEPVVHGDLDNYEIKPRLMLPLSLGFDHRVNDGADAANFVTTLIGALEDPQSLLLKI